MHATEIIVGEVQSASRFQVRQLLRESVRQTCKVTHRDAWCLTTGYREDSMSERQTVPENPLTDAVRARLEPEDASLPRLCCTSAGFDELQLLTDLRACLPERTKEGRRIIRIATSSVIQLLQAGPGSPWRGLSPHKLARMLGSFDVHPCAIRFRNGVFRGYSCDELQSAFLTRLPPQHHRPKIAPRTR